MRAENQPVYMISVAAQLCGVHPQTLRQYERLGLVVPSRAGAKNRLYSEADIRQVRRIQQLTQQMGVNLAGVEIILRLLDELDDMRRDVEEQISAYRDEVERKVQSMMVSNVPIRRDETLLPVPNIRFRRKIDL
ncbi:MAG TPA: helix-turn-helix transcriptional regulator [Fimbriimonadaceae bacterium]|nr:helix-turn-helix transcriptional regulator [Fimbriimonadaceae bacterium]